MPCRDDRDYCITQSDLNNVEKIVRAELEPLLCEACSHLEEEGILESHGSKELVAWYVAHEQKEMHRVRLEAAQKLSERERRLLGIDLNALQQTANKKRR